MPTLKNEYLVGFVFGRLKIIGPPIRKPDSGYIYYDCICQCGKKVSVRRSDLGNGTNSCGCLRSERVSAAVKTHGHSGKVRSVEYNTWMNLKQRCSNRKRRGHENYKNIKVCRRWLNSFENFLEDMGKRPDPKLTIERKNNKRGYGPNNCIWATRKEQCRNFRRNVWIEHNGLRMIVTDWAIELGATTTMIKHHIKKGKSFEEIFYYFMAKKIV